MYLFQVSTFSARTIAILILPLELPFLTRQPRSHGVTVTCHRLMPSSDLLTCTLKIKSLQINRMPLGLVWNSLPILHAFSSPLKEFKANTPCGTYPWTDAQWKDSSAICSILRRWSSWAWRHLRRMPLLTSCRCFRILQHLFAQRMASSMVFWRLESSTKNVIVTLCSTRSCQPVANCTAGMSTIALSSHLSTSWI